MKEKSEFVVISVVMGVFLWPCAPLHCTTSPGCSFCVGESVAIPLKTRTLLDVFSYFSGITAELLCIGLFPQQLFRVCSSMLGLQHRGDADCFMEQS